jgi:hypothetical protein
LISVEPTDQFEIQLWINSDADTISKYDMILRFDPEVRVTGSDLHSWRFRFPHPNPSPSGTLVLLDPGGRPAPAPYLVCDNMGRIIKAIDPNPGSYGCEFAWDGRDALGRRVPSGVYFLWLGKGNEAQVRKLLIV